MSKVDNIVDCTDMSIGERVKYVRVDVLKISLESFSSRLGMKSRSSMSRYERSGFQFSDRVIKQICTEFLINEHWLRTGEGDIFETYVDDLKEICKKYNIDDGSERLIRTFIALDATERESISKFLISLGSGFSKNEVIEHSLDVISSQKVLHIDEKEDDDSEIIELPLYSTKASAGIGKYLGDNDPYEITSFPLNRVTRKADFAVNVCGDSMEPLIADGETIFIKSMPRIEPNQIGLFLYNEEVFCKRLILDRKKSHVVLRSENKAYKDIIVHDPSQLRTLGLVLI